MYSISNNDMNNLDFEIWITKSKKKKKKLFLVNILWWGVKGWHALSNGRNIFLTRMHIKIWMLKLLVMRCPIWASSDLLRLRNSWFKSKLECQKLVSNSFHLTMNSKRYCWLFVPYRTCNCKYLMVSNHFFLSFFFFIQNVILAFSFPKCIK